MHLKSPATCVSKPVYYKNCGTCYYKGTETYVYEWGNFDPNNHTGNEEIRGAVEATCTTAGYTGDTYCKDCDALLSSGTVIPAAGHTGGTATCKDSAVCEVCHKPYGEKDAANHVGGTEVRSAAEAACTQDGYTGDTYCKGCDALLLSSGTAIPAAGEHTGGTPTCLRRAKCEVCGESTAISTARTMQTAACRNGPSPRRSTRKNIPAAASSSRKPARIPLETGPSRRSRRKARKASRSASARSAAAPRRKRSPLRKLRQAPPLPRRHARTHRGTRCRADRNRLQRAARGGYSSRSFWSVWLPVSAPVSPSGGERKSNAFPIHTKSRWPRLSHRLFRLYFGRSRAPPLRAQFRYSCRGGLCPARPKGNPSVFCLRQIRRPCQGEASSYRKPLTGGRLSAAERASSPMGIKPAGDLVQTAEPVLRLAAAGKLVVLAAEENKTALHAVRRERGVHLIPLIDGAAVILQRVDEERGRFDFVGVFHRAVLPEFLRVRPEGRATLILREVGADIGYAVKSSSSSIWSAGWRRRGSGRCGR